MRTLVFPTDSKISADCIDERVFAQYGLNSNKVIIEFMVTEKFACDYFGVMIIDGQSSTVFSTDVCESDDDTEDGAIACGAKIRFELSLGERTKFAKEVEPPTMYIRGTIMDDTGIYFISNGCTYVVRISFNDDGAPFSVKIDKAYYFGS